MRVVFSGPERFVQYVFLGVIAAFFGIHGGGVLNYLFAPLSLIVAIFLYSRRPFTEYLSFVFLLWMFTPAVRRVVDWQSGYHIVSLVMLAPTVATSVSWWSFVRAPEVGFSKAGAPFLIIALVAAYGALLGALQGAGFAALYALLNWLAPIGLALHLLRWRTEIAPASKSIFSALAWGGLFSGVYGVIQFLSPLPWDTYWMRYAEMTSIGRPVAGQIRVFSTMNSPGPFAQFVTASLLVFFSSDGGFARLLGPAPALAALGLSLVRSAWGGIVVGLSTLFAMARPGEKIKYLAIGGVASLLVLPLVAFGPIGEGVQKRFESISRLETDVSFRARYNFYAEVGSDLLGSAIGTGIGATGTATRLTNDEGSLGQHSSFDSGILDLLFSFGWGGVVILGSLAAISSAVIMSARTEQSKIAVSIFSATLIQLLFVNTLVAPVGLLIFPMAAIALSSTSMSPRRL